MERPGEWNNVVKAPGRQRHALVFTGGPFPDSVLSHLVDELPAYTLKTDLVVAADGGALVVRRLGLPIDLLVGDLDSADDQSINDAADVRRHPVDKNETDLELALHAVLARGFGSATVVVTLAGRIDHALGNLQVVTSNRWASLQIDLRIDSALGWVVRDAQRIEGRVGDTVGLLAIGQQATGVTTIGLAWPLNDAVLEPGTGLGLSNRMTEEVAEIRMSSGVLLVLKDGPDRPDHE